MFKNYLKTAIRNLAGNKISSAINIIGLAFGMVTCIIIFLITKFELSYDTFHPEKERIYRLVSEMQHPSGEKDYLPMVPDPAPEAIRKEFTGIESVASFHTINANAMIAIGKTVKKFDRTASDVAPSEIIVSDPEYFDIFKYKWLAGSVTALNDPFKVVLTENKAHKYFGQLAIAEIIGKEIIYNDSLRFTVVGIVKDLSGNSDLTFKDFLSSATIKQYDFGEGVVNPDNWMFWRGSSQAFIKLKPGTVPATVIAQLAELKNKKISRGDGTKITFGLQPLKDLHFNTIYRDDMYQRKAHLPTLYGLMGIAAFILIIAAINFINLTTAQSVRRTKEIGIRKVLGSSRKSLALQFLGETFVLTLIALLAAVLLVPVALSGFHSFIPEKIALDLSDPATLLFLSFVCIITSLLAGFYPARILSSYLPVTSLKGRGFEKINQKGYLRKGLIIFQFTASLLFIIGSLIVADQMHYMLNKDMGFNKDAVINILTRRTYTGSRADILAEKASKLPGVQLASLDMGTPADNDHWNTIVQCKEINAEEVEAQMLGGDEHYLPLYQLKLVAGRNLQHCDSMKEFLINESLAKRFGFKRPEDAVGKILETDMTDGDSRKRCPIVGVIADFHTQSLHEAIKPAFVVESKMFCNAVSIKLNTKGKGPADFKATISNIEKIWKELYPNEKFEYTFFDQAIAQFYAKEQKISAIINLAMLITIFISCMGLFGLATFTTQQRTKEIGIRKILGASVFGIISLLSKEFLKPVFVAILIASPIAWFFMNKWLQDFAYRINIEWWMFVLAGILAVIIALLTVSFQAIKAAIVNPVKNLRTE